MLKSTRPLGKVAFVLIASLLLLPRLQVFAADIGVDANCTLAQAITAANTDAAVDGSSCPAGSGADVIALSADITLTAPLPSITTEIKIEGGGYVISGDDAYRIFDVGAAGFLTINNLAMTRGLADSGGAIAVNAGSAIVTDSTLSGNSAGQNGGAIAVGSGVVIITGSALSGNSAGQNGGAIAVSSGVVIINSSAFVGNAAVQNGGGMYSSGNLTLTNSTFSENSAAGGGGLYAATASGIASLTHATFFGNTVSSAAGGGLHIDEATVHLRNSIIYGSVTTAENTDPSDCDGTLTQDVGNLIGSGDCSATAITSDPMLGALTDGYYPITDESPAFDAADSELCATADQLGTPRPQEAACDIGAFEYVKPIEAQAQQLSEGDIEPEVTEEPTSTPEPTPTLTPTPTATPQPSTCLTSLPDSIVVSNFRDSTQCQQLDGGGIGIPSIIEEGFIDAVDIWSYVVPGTQVCFRQSSGRFIFLDAETMPRAIIPLSLSYRVRDDVSEMICTQIDRAGSVILMPE